MATFPSKYRRRRFRGLTLVELLVSMAIASALLVGLASAVRLSTLSLENSNTDAVRAVDAGDALDRLTSELRLAQTFSERTATAVTFTVPDQSGDGFPETVRYAWAGSGSPLTRTINGVSAPCIDDVRSLNFLFLSRTLQSLEQQHQQQSTEQQLAAFNSGSSTKSVTPTLWVGQYFLPTLPADTVSWKITRIRLYFKIARRVTTNETLRIAVYKAGTKGLPTGSPLETKLLPLSVLSTTTAAVDIPYSSLSGLLPKQGLMIQVQSVVKPSQAVSLALQSNLSPAPKNLFYYTSTTQGATWVAPTSATAVKFQVYGTITQPTP